MAKETPKGVEAKLLANVQGMFGDLQPGQLVLAPADMAAAWVACGVIDPHPDAVAHCVAEGRTAVPLVLV